MTSDPAGCYDRAMKRSWIGALALLLACGGSATTNTDAGADGAASDGGACVSSPKVGQACASGAKPCDRVDPCCAQTLVCDAMTSVWKNSGVACIQCEGFSCGAQTCMGGTVCVAAGVGIPPPDGGPTVNFSCAPMPAACARDWTCDCVSKNLPPSCVSLTNCTAQGLHPKLDCKGI